MRSPPDRGSSPAWPPAHHRDARSFPLRKHPLFVTVLAVELWTLSPRGLVVSKAIPASPALQRSICWRPTTRPSWRRWSTTNRPSWRRKACWRSTTALSFAAPSTEVSMHHPSPINQLPPGPIDWYSKLGRRLNCPPRISLCNDKIAALKKAFPRPRIYQKACVWPIADPDR